MESVGPAIVLLAKLLIMGPQGTQVLSEQRASIPAGATGLLKEVIHETNLPGVIALQITPRPALRTGPSSGDQPVKVLLQLRADLWDRSAPESTGRAPDETNIESVELEPDISRLVQLAEDPESGRRLLVSLRIVPASENAATPTAVVPGPPAEPREIAFRVEAFRDRNGVRELLSTHILRTLEGRPVSCQSSWTQIIGGRGRVSATPQEELSLTLLPQPPRDGWVTVEATLTARLLPLPGSTDPVLLNAAATRTLPLGIPFEVCVTAPASEGDKKSNAGPVGETYIVQITPYLASPSVPNP